MAKSLGYFFQATTKCFISSFFGLVKSYSISPVCLQPSTLLLTSVLITYLITLRLEKEIIVSAK